MANPTIAILVLTADNLSDVDYYVGKVVSPHHLQYADQVYQFANKRRGVKKFTEDIFAQKNKSKPLIDVVKTFATSRAKKENCSATVHTSYAYLTKAELKKYMKGESV